MIKLYHCVSARSFRPLWMLEELGLPYELVLLPFPPRLHHKEYMAVNPLGTVPAFFDGATAMTESAAICAYIAATYGDGALEVRVGDPAFGTYLNGLHFGEATLTFPQTLVLRYGRFEPEERRQPQVVEDYSRWFLARLRGVAAATAGSPFMCAYRFTAADVSVGYALMLAEYLGLQPRFPEGVASYWARLKERPGYLNALRAQERAAFEQAIPATPVPLL